MSAEVGAFTLDGTVIGVISGVLAVIDVGLFFAGRGTLRREEILTRWRYEAVIRIRPCLAAAVRQLARISAALVSSQSCTTFASG